MIRANFWLAFATSLAWAVYKLVWNTHHGQAINGTYRMFAPRVFLFPIWLIMMQVLGWIWFYRFGDLRARAMAGIVAWWLALQVFIKLMQMSIDTPVDGRLVALFAYWSFSFGLFALFGRARDV